MVSGLYRIYSTFLNVEDVQVTSSNPAMVFIIGRIVEVLRLVQFVSAGVACGVEVADVLDVVTDGGDDIALQCPHRIA